MTNYFYDLPADIIDKIENNVLDEYRKEHSKKMGLLFNTIKEGKEDLDHYYEDYEGEFAVSHNDIEDLMTNYGDGRAKIIFGWCLSSMLPWILEGLEHSGAIYDRFEAVEKAIGIDYTETLIKDDDLVLVDDDHPMDGSDVKEWVFYIKECIIHKDKLLVEFQKNLKKSMNTAMKIAVDQWFNDPGSHMFLRLGIPKYDDDECNIDVYLPSE
jgi:hypothetical protein